MCHNGTLLPITTVATLAHLHQLLCLHLLLLLQRESMLPVHQGSRGGQGHTTHGLQAQGQACPFTGLQVYRPAQACSPSVRPSKERLLTRTLVKARHMMAAVLWQGPPLPGMMQATNNPGSSWPVLVPSCFTLWKGYPSAARAAALSASRTSGGGVRGGRAGRPRGMAWAWWL
jgi:hypothetical protein